MIERLADWWVDNVRGGRPWGMSWTDYYGPRTLPLPLFFVVGVAAGVAVALAVR